MSSKFVRLAAGGVWIPTCGSAIPITSARPAFLRRIRARQSKDLDGIPAYLASAVLRLGAAAGTNGESRFGRSEQTPAVGQPDRFLSRGEWLESACAVIRRRFPVGARPTRRSAPAGSSRSSHGGNEMAEAFE